MGNSRQFADDLGWAAIRVVVGVVRRLDITGVIALGRFLGRVAFDLLGVRKSVAALNFEVALEGELDSRRKRRVLRKASANAGAVILETLYYCLAPRKSIVQNVAIKGIEHLTAARAAGRGVILAGGHLGGFTLVSTRLSREGYPSWVILRLAHEPRASQLYQDMMGQAGVNWIADRPRSLCVRECFARLRCNEILHVLIDQKPARGRGCVVPFFGIPTEMFPGAVSLALRTGATVLPVTVHRQRGPRHILEIGPPIEIVRSGNRRRDMKASLRNVVRTFEKAIGSFPEEWWAISRRWGPEQLAQRRRARSEGRTSPAPPHDVQ
jgi:lauroyl/myristoyl acyltransferase